MLIDACRDQNGRAAGNCRVAEKTGETAGSIPTAVILRRRIGI